MCCRCVAVRASQQGTSRGSGCVVDGAGVRCGNGWCRARCTAARTTRHARTTRLSLPRVRRTTDLGMTTSLCMRASFPYTTRMQWEPRYASYLTQPRRMNKGVASLTAEARPLIVQVSVYSRRGVALTRKTRGLAGPNSTMNGTYETPTTDDMDGELVLAQRLEITCEHTLEDLVREIVCRNGDIPERVDEGGRESLAHGSNWTGAHDQGSKEQYPKFTGGMLQTDACLLLEGMLYGMQPVESETSYARTLLESSATGIQATYGGTMRATRLRDLTRVAFHQPYWILHAGDCEHLWTMDWARYVFLLIQSPCTVRARRCIPPNDLSSALDADIACTAILCPQKARGAWRPRHPLLRVWRHARCDFCRAGRRHGAHAVRRPCAPEWHGTDRDALLRRVPASGAWAGLRARRGAAVMDCDAVAASQRIVQIGYILSAKVPQTRPTFPACLWGESGGRES